MTITEAQQQLYQLPDELTDEPVILTKDGKSVMTVLRYEQFASLLETLEILSDTEFAAQLREDIRQAEAGRTISWEDAMAKLGL